MGDPLTHNKEDIPFGSEMLPYPGNLFGESFFVIHQPFEHILYRSVSIDPYHTILSINNDKITDKLYPAAYEETIEMLMDA